MKRHKTLTALSLGLLASTVLLGLLSGFVPQTEGPSIRRKASPIVVSPRPEDMPAPIVCMGDGDHLWALRRQVAPQGSPAEADRQNAPVEKARASIIIFEDNAIRLNMGDGSHLFEEEAAPLEIAPLLALDGVSIPSLVAVLPPQHGDVLDASGRPLRWGSMETILAGYLPRVSRKTDGSDAPDADTTAPHEPRLAERVSGGAQQYRQLVENFSRRYQLSAELVYAIIHSESNFVPSLVSNKSAMGLMQLLPSTASGEVHRFLYGRPGAVSYAELRVPEINIRYGTAYLHILLTRYFQDVEDPLSREYCAIAAYNMGPNRFLRIYGRTNAEAVAAINAMSTEELYDDLTGRLPVRETRSYVAKVRRMKGHYAELN